MNARIVGAILLASFGLGCAIYLFVDGSLFGMFPLLIAVAAGAWAMDTYTANTSPAPKALSQREEAEIYWSTK